MNFAAKDDQHSKVDSLDMNWLVCFYSLLEAFLYVSTIYGFSSVCSYEVDRKLLAYNYFYFLFQSIN